MAEDGTDGRRHAGAGPDGPGSQWPDPGGDNPGWPTPGGDTPDRPPADEPPADGAPADRESRTDDGSWSAVERRADRNYHLWGTPDADPAPVSEHAGGGGRWWLWTTLVIVGVAAAITGGVLGARGSPHRSRRATGGTATTAPYFPVLSGNCVAGDGIFDDGAAATAARAAGVVPVTAVAVRSDRTSVTVTLTFDGPPPTTLKPQWELLYVVTMAPGTGDAFSPHAVSLLTGFSPNLGWAGIVQDPDDSTDMPTAAVGPRRVTVRFDRSQITDLPDDFSWSVMQVQGPVPGGNPGPGSQGYQLCGTQYPG